MKNRFIFFILVLINASSFAQYPPLAWAKKIEAKDQLNAQCAISVNAVDEQGAIYASGYFRDSLRPDNNLMNTYLAGNSNWDSGAFIKYDANGNLIWAKSIVARVGYFYVSDLDIDQFHNVYILCQAVYTDTIDFDPSTATANEISDGNDFFLAKYDVNGNYIWSKRINVINGNNTFSNSPNTLTVDSNQNIFIGGRFQNQIDLDPSAATLTITNPGGVNCNCTVGFYAKYDTNGNIIWGFADVNNSSITSIDINELNGQIVIGGQPGSNSQPLKLCNANGTLISSLNGGSIYTKSVKFDTLGNFYFSGYFHSTVDFDWSNASYVLTTPASYELAGFVGKYDSQGNFQWAVEYDPTLDPSFDANYYNITIDTDNNPIVAYGETNGSGYRKGFFKISASNGSALWPNSMFEVLVGLNGTDAIPSPSDGTIVFSAGVGFSSNAIVGFDAAPDPSVTLNITGTGYWSFMAKYGNCVAAPLAPGAISGNTSLCNTDSVTYSVPLQNGVSTYNWTIPNGWTGSSNTNTITVLPGNNSGTVQVVANNLCGASAAANLQVNYVGTPNVLANASATQVCLGDSIVLSGAGADTYVWNNNVIDGIAFVPSNSSSYIVTGSLNGCTNSDTVSVTVKPLPVVGLNLAPIDTLCQDAGVVNLIGESPSGGVFSGTGVTSNTFDALTSGLGIHTITYTFTDANACVNNAVDSIYVDICVSVNESVANTNWAVFPNPSENEFTVYSYETNNEIWVTDLLGKVIIQKIINQNNVKLHIAESGVYMVFMKTEEGVSQKKLVIK
jgi:hypothetical protein